MERIRIIHLLSYAKFTGPAEPILRLARFQQQTGHEVRLAIDLKRKGNLRERAVPFGIPMDQHLILSPSAGPILQLKNLVELSRIWRNGCVDIIHANRTNDHFLAAISRPLRTSAGLIRTLHSERAQGEKRKRLLKRADGLIVIAEKYRKSLLESLQMDPRGITVISGAVDSNMFHPKQDGIRVRKEFGVDLDAPVAGIVARMKKGRGHLWLLESWAEVHNQLPEAVLFIAGRGPLSEELKTYAQGSTLGNSVKFIGYRTDLPELYPAFSLKVILAPGNDGTCRAALEAMASGIPVLAADVGALSEIIDHEKTGLLVPNNDRKALADALITLLRNSQKRIDMGMNARRAAMLRYTIDRQADTIENLYRYVLGKKQMGHKSK